VQLVDRALFTSSLLTLPLSLALLLCRLQLPKVATGTPSLRAASCCPTDSASLMALTLNSSVYCRLEEQRHVSEDTRTLLK